MKLSFALLSSALLVGSSNAFTAHSAFHTRKVAGSTQLNLFGGGGGKDGEGKPNAMVQQMNAIKDAQKAMMAKKKMDEALAKEDYKGVAADGTTTVVMKYVPPPFLLSESSCSVESITFDEGWYEGASVDDIKGAVKDAYTEAKKEVQKKMVEIAEAAKAAK